MALSPNYEHFIAGKEAKHQPSGFDYPQVLEDERLRGQQAHGVYWALGKGRAAIFYDTGLGKTRMELVIAEAVKLTFGTKTLILDPLGVVSQTIVNPTDVLPYAGARAAKDERHICPLQLGVIRRCVQLWSNPGDLVFSPFVGVGSEGHVAIQEGRKFRGTELKRSYFRQAAINLRRAIDIKQPQMFHEAEDVPA